ncbi:hypothetical protein [Azohydromonas australica]|uniref:hypothetical protein n=1 Tax=Azohydromonas australica TaxID=364039 RepID=UPI00048ABF49|nr:hypothetical protein [Azohydromonas australica]
MSPPRQARGLARWVVQFAILALLLKAAVPLLASAAARLQGVAVGEVCELYGVPPAQLTLQSLPAAHDDAHAAHAAHAKAAEPASHGKGSEAAHRSDHCALAALAALAPQSLEAATLLAFLPWESRAHGHAPAATAFRDASAAWAARLKHGPPAHRRRRFPGLKPAGRRRGGPGSRVRRRETAAHACRAFPALATLRATVPRA